MLETSFELPQLKSVALEYGGRFFPGEYSDRYRNHKVSVSTIDKNAARSHSQRELANSIWNQLPFANTEPTEKDQAIESYIESLGKLNQLRTDVDEFLDKVCLANFELRQTTEIIDEEQRDKSVKDKLAKMRSDAELTIQPPKNHIDAGRATLPLELMIPELRNALRDSVTEFVNDFYEGLRKLVDKQIFGLIEWPGENVCRYHFFREVLLHAQSQVDATEELVRFDDDLWAIESTNGTTGSNTHRLSRHEHHVINAYVTSPDNTRVVIPPNIQQAVNSIPNWLKPIISIVDGTLIREIIIEQDVFHEHWENIDARVEVIPQDDPIYGCEPAVIIDEFVLTGWGPNEIDAELQRRQETANQTAVAQRIINANRNQHLFLGAGLAAQLISMWMLIKSLNAPGLWFLSAFAFCASPPLWMASTREKLFTANSIPFLLQPELRVAGWSALAASIHFFVIGTRVGWGTMLFSAVLLVTGVTLAKIKLAPDTSSSLTDDQTNDSNR